MSPVHRFMMFGGVEMPLLAVAGMFGIIAVIRTKDVALAMLLAGLVCSFTGLLIANVAMTRVGEQHYNAVGSFLELSALGRRTSIVGALLTLVGWILLAKRRTGSNQSTDPAP